MRYSTPFTLPKAEPETTEVETETTAEGAAATEVTEAAAELAATPSLPREKKSANKQV